MDIGREDGKRRLTIIGDTKQSVCVAFDMYMELCLQNGHPMEMHDNEAEPKFFRVIIV